MSADKPPIALQEAFDRAYKHLRLEWIEEISALRVYTRMKPIQCYSLSAMDELQRVFDDVEEHSSFVKHFVMSSEATGVYNFGGDLALFLILIKKRDLKSLEFYGHRCVHLIHWMERAADIGVHTTVLVQGDTLGGGLESILPFHKIIFERSAKAGFPEVLFNLFPGMGGWHLAIRKAGFAVANELILSGKLFTAEELLSRHLIDVIAEDNAGEETLKRTLLDVHPRLRGTLAALRARSLVMPLTVESLIDVVDQWAATSIKLTPRDLRLMERLSKAQLFKAGGTTPEEIAEIREQELQRARESERTGITEWSVLH